MGKEITIKLPDGTIISVPEGSSTETIRTIISLVTGKGETLDIEEEVTKINTQNELLSASKKERIASIVRNHYPENDWFTSNDIEILYSKIFNEGIRLSTVSTTLSRMADEGLLTRRGNVSQRYYAVTKKLLNAYGELDIHSIPDLISK
ncbi:MAG: hypothetical protein K9W46_09750 [Candidatus Heimdallarchaeum endolithica]|uniref:Uncharacterized protein n=1 Tax=Candidatus Heimdallarchaeum endolithica TaxID=2876572 RepID=A0A9Y1BQT7_9ARCH|nr:MAG: hypothetical protein K9W46_09750 [Candidatus Heimdallarchaeum endolithica]